MKMKRAVFHEIVREFLTEEDDIHPLRNDSCFGTILQESGYFVTTKESMPLYLIF